MRAFVDFNKALIRLDFVSREREKVIRYAPVTLAGSTFTPGPMVEEMAMRWT